MIFIYSIYFSFQCIKTFFIIYCKNKQKTIC